jgi:hypothetical protein
MDGEDFPTLAGNQRVRPLVTEGRPKSFELRFKGNHLRKNTRVRKAALYRPVLCVGLKPNLHFSPDDESRLPGRQAALCAKPVMT